MSVPSALADPQYGTLRSTLLWRDRMVTVVGERRDTDVPDDAGYSVFFPGLESSSGQGGEFVDSYTRGVPITGRFQNCSVLAILAAEAGVRVKIPYTFACKMKRYIPITIIEHDIGDADFEVHLAWSSVFDADPGHRWIRNLIIKSLADKPFW